MPHSDEIWFEMKLNQYMEGSLENRIKKARSIVREHMGAHARVVSTMDGHVVVLNESGDVLRVNIDWDGEVVESVEETGESVISTKGEVGRFVVGQMNEVAGILLDGDTESASSILSECAAYLDEGAGHWALESILSRFERFEGRSWRDPEGDASDAGLEHIVRPAVIPESDDRAKLIRSQIGNMIANCEELLERIGESLSEGNSSDPKQMKDLAFDVRLLSEWLEDAVECIPYAREEAMSFYAEAQTVLSEMARAFAEDQF